MIVAPLRSVIALIADWEPSLRFTLTDFIMSLAIDRSGNVYLWDFDNRRVRAIRGIAR